MNTLIPEPKDLNFKGLRYKSFSIVYMQTFGINECICRKFDEKYICVDENPIDALIFNVGEGEVPPVTRFKLPPFEISVDLDEPYPVTVKGKVFVEMSLFFNRTVTLTYRFMVDGEEASSTAPLTTDQIISLSAFTLGAEHWNSQDDKTPSNINLTLNDVIIRNLMVDEGGNWLQEPTTILPDKEKLAQGTQFDEVCRRYRAAIMKGQDPINFKPLNYIYIDVWEDIDNYNGSLQKMAKEEDIITYISKECKKELIGLMTSYPQEWPYRDEEAFDDACGYNIAIDTDDLVLLNTSICVVFGTYGRRGKNSATDWQEHLAERKHYHVSWPEYMLILEMVLAKKYTIGAAKNLLLGSLKNCSTTNATRDEIENNAKIELRVTELLLRLDAVNYSKFMSHKIMFDRTIRRLDIAGDEQVLKGVMEKVSNSLYNLLNMRSIKQATMLNIFLAAISVASLFQIIFMETEIPFLELIGLSKSIGTGTGIFFQSLAFILVFAGTVIIGYLVLVHYKLGILDLFRYRTYRRVLNWMKSLSKEVRERERNNAKDMATQGAANESRIHAMYIMEQKKKEKESGKKEKKQK